jgi:hypothetical protein
MSHLCYGIERLELRDFRAKETETTASIPSINSERNGTPSIEAVRGSGKKKVDQ